MKLETLTKPQVEELYKERLVEDFPPNELKPLPIILKALDEGRYETLGLCEDGAIIGYVFLVKLGRDFLVDYLAVFPERRNKGAGGIMLGLIREHLKDAASIICEVEDPECAEDESQRSLQERRLFFYLRNGCVDTGVRVRTFGVPYIVLNLGRLEAESSEEIWELYQSTYREILPGNMFRGNIEWMQKSDQ